jgi:hypothetical protein
LFGVAARHYARWTGVPASDVVKARLRAALAVLYTEAGWAYHAADPRIPTLTAWLNLNSATAYALMDIPEQAKHCLATAREGWTPRDARERATTDRATAEIRLRRGACADWGARGLMLARQAIEAVSTLQSVAVRRERLVPLVTALEARPGNDAKEIARIAHQVAATRM